MLPHNKSPSGQVATRDWINAGRVAPNIATRLYYNDPDRPLQSKCVATLLKQVEDSLNGTKVLFESYRPLLAPWDYAKFVAKHRTYLLEVAEEKQRPRDQGGWLNSVLSVLWTLPEPGLDCALALLEGVDTYRDEVFSATRRATLEIAPTPPAEATRPQRHSTSTSVNIKSVLSDPPPSGNLPIRPGHETNPLSLTNSTLASTSYTISSFGTNSANSTNTSYSSYSNYTDYTSHTSQAVCANPSSASASKAAIRTSRTTTFEDQGYLVTITDYEDDTPPANPGADATKLSSQDQDKFRCMLTLGDFDREISLIDPRLYPLKPDTAQQEEAETSMLDMADIAGKWMAQPEAEVLQGCRVVEGPAGPSPAVALRKFQHTDEDI